MALAPRHTQAGQGKTFRVIGGDVITIKATGAETGGALAAIETIVPPQGGPPPHVHHREEEMFYVLEGTFEFHVGDRRIAAGAGDFLLAPRDIPHYFRNVGSGPGKLFILVQPAGFENFIEEFAELPVDAPPDFPRMAAIGAKYGIEFVPH